MKVTLTFLACVTLSLVTTARAELVWEKTEVELHPKSDDKTAVGTFKYQNKGDKPVHIVSVHTSCGCTTAGKTKDDVAPGETGEITATFNIGGRTGVQQKTVTVQTDDPKQPTTVLTLKAVIAQLLEIQPTFVFWQTGEAPKPKTIIAKASKELPVSGLDVTSSNPDFITKVEKGDGGEFRINVQPRETTKSVAATLTIKANSPSAPAKTFFATARVTPATSPAPTQ